MRKEHEFGRLKTQEEWDRAVFDAAVSFSVFKRGVGKVEDIKTFADAVLLAISWGENGALIYAITEAGRSTCIPRSTWQDLLGSRRRTRLNKAARCAICKNPGGKLSKFGERWLHASCWRIERMK